MRENRFRWLGHVLRREKTKAVKLVKEIYVEGKRGRARPEMRWLDVIKIDMKRAGVSVDEDAGDRVRRKLKICVADSK